MKRLFTLALLGAATLAAGAQCVEGHKFLDNWSLGLMGGAEAPTTRSWFGHTRGVLGLDLTKQITPVFGVGVETVAGFNTTGSYTAVDNLNTSLLGKVNFSNLFWAYTGTPRLFEVEGVVGIGFSHYFGGGTCYEAASGNELTSKFGLNFNFNLGPEKAWTVALKPAIVYGLEGGLRTTDVQYNVNNSVIELTAGVVYHFRNSNHKHHFTLLKPYDQSEVDALNAKVNDLRGMVAERDRELRRKEGEVRELQQKLNDCRNQQPVVQRVVSTKQTMESVVTFRQGKSTVDASQLPNVERVATYMKRHADAKVVIKGYASPEGSAEINERLARERAEAVKSILVKKYGISQDRITAEGQGVGNLFSELDWNRVSICTLDEGR